MDSLFNAPCPAVMADGARFITDYNAHMTLTQDIRKQNNLYSTHSFRDFLQKNALVIMEKDRGVDKCRPLTKCSYPSGKVFEKQMPLPYMKK